MFYYVTGPAYGQDFRFDVALGRANGLESASIAGSNPVFPQNSEQDISDQGGDITLNLQDIDIEFDMISDNAGDTAAGAGTNAVLITGLDASNVVKTELVSTNGGTVQIPGTWKRINGALGVASGSNNVNLGDIDIVERATPANIHLRMRTGLNNAFPGLFSNPAGKLCVAQKVSGSSSRNDEFVLTPYRRQAGGNLISGQEVPIFSNDFSIDLWDPFIIQPGEDIFYRARRIGSGGGDAYISIIVELTLIDL